MLCCVCADLQSSEIFKENGGPKTVVGIISSEREDVNILDGCFLVVAAASTGNEVLKESFMDLKIDELILQILKEHNGGSIPSIYDAIRVILSSDDNRVVASQVSQLFNGNLPARVVDQQYGVVNDAQLGMRKAQWLFHF